ncbi:MAG: YggU family protein [Thermoplasmata archaeon]|nr:MAG: YggU family protein [Thermoplasmata archaeon]
MTNVDDSIGESMEGVTLKIHVSTNSKKNLFPAGYDEWRKSIEIHVTQPPQDNKANKEIIQIISNFFNTKTENVKIISGKSSREKRIMVLSMSKKEVIDKLRGAFDELQ